MTSPARPSISSSDESRAMTGQVLKVDGGWSVSDASDWAGPEVGG